MHIETEPFSRAKEPEEYALLRAILGRAILDALSANDRIRREALQWLSSESVEPFSCVWIVDTLELPDNFVHEEIERRRSEG
jgi:hypothetical protein